MSTFVGDKDLAFYGKAVRDGVLRYSSPSGLDAADTAQPAGCVRRWWYRYVQGVKEESSKSAEKGDEYHAQIEAYCRTGQGVLAAPPRSALHIIPDPGPDLLLEWALAPVPPGREPFPPGHKFEGKVFVEPSETGRLWAGPVPMVGFVDLAHARGTNKGASEILETQDPPGTIEVLDWKFTNDLAKKLAYTTPEAVETATPMVGYGHALACAWESAGYDVPLVRLSQGLISMKKREPARKVTRLVPRDELARRWEARGPIARTIYDAARETDPEKVDANTRACDAYNRTCPNRPYCSAGMHGSLAKLFGYGKQPSEMKGLDMSVLDKLNIPPPPAAAGPQLPPGVAQLPPPQVGVAVSLPPPPVVQTHPLFAQAWSYIEMAGVGTPTTTGEAANALSALKGWQVPPGTAHNGTGQIGPQVTCKTSAEVVTIAKALADRRNDAQSSAFFAGTGAPAVPTPPAAPPAPPPPAPPPSAPATAAYYPPPPAPAQAAGTAAILPPDAPASQPQLAANPVAPTPAEVAAGTFPVAATPAPQAAAPAPTLPPGSVAAAPAEKKTRTRKAKETGSTPATTPPTAAENDADGIELFVDAIPSTPYTDLAGKVDEWAAALAAAFNADDVRCAGEDTPIGYSKWKGGLAAFVDAKVKDGDLPPGTYVLFARRNEVHDVAAAAIRKHCTLFVRGI